MIALTEDQRRVAETLNGYEICSGLGAKTPGSHCTIGWINYALTGRVTDERHPCVSNVSRLFVIPLQDAIPHDIRNSPRWRAIVPRLVGTGQNHETERLAVALDWMWVTVLPQVQPIADGCGFGGEWKLMLAAKTAAYAAGSAAYAADAAADAADAAAADAAAAYAARAADAARAAGSAAYAARAAAYAARAAARAVDAYAARAADAARAEFWEKVSPCGVVDAARAEFWEKVNPCGVVERMIDVSK